MKTILHQLIRTVGCIVCFGWAVLLLLWWGVHRVFRFNLLAYLLTTSLLLLTNAATDLLRQPSFYFRANGAVLIAAALALLLWPLMGWLRGKSKPHADAASDASPLPA